MCYHTLLISFALCFRLLHRYRGVHPHTQTLTHTQNTQSHTHRASMSYSTEANLQHLFRLSSQLQNVMFLIFCCLLALGVTGTTSDVMHTCTRDSMGPPAKYSYADRQSTMWKCPYWNRLYQLLIEIPRGIPLTLALDLLDLHFLPFIFTKQMIRSLLLIVIFF